MPELPEVETVVRGLRASMPGRTMLDVRIGKTDFIDDPTMLAAQVPGRRVADVARYGKFISIRLESPCQPIVRSNGLNEVSTLPVHLIIHLGMTGQLTISRPDDPVAAHTHCFFGLDDGRELRYTDIRRFGRMSIVQDELMPEFIGHLGEEPLQIGAEEFCKGFGVRRARVKALLLDQSVLRGVGNIYADESLFRARLHPARIAQRLTRNQLMTLRQSLREILTAAIRLRGSSISDYVDADGNRGEYQLRHRVYQREGKPCVRCGKKIRRMIVAGRSSFFCPHCQPVPRRRRIRAKQRPQPGMNADTQG
jgi:formamidopyrimidine-DNA glycosylase